MKYDLKKIGKRFYVLVFVFLIMVSIYLIFNKNSELEYNLIKIEYPIFMFIYSTIFLYYVQFFFLRKYYKMNNHTLENKFVVFEKSYFVVWSLISVLYCIIIFLFNSNNPFEAESNSFLSVLGWNGTIFYVLSAFYLCIDNFLFCKDILSYKRYRILFSKFTRSILTAITSWLIVIVFIYNNSANNRIPFHFFMLYITISIVVAFLYPLLDLYQYTFEEVEKHEKERRKREKHEKERKKRHEKEEQKYDLYNYD